MDPFFVIIRARDKFFGSGLNRRVSRGRKRSRLLTIDNELEKSCLEGRHHVVQPCMVITSI